MIETGPSRKTSPWRRSMAWQARAVGVGLLLHVSCVAVAQQAVIDHCRKTSTDADRIACLEAALIDRGRGAVNPARLLAQYELFIGGERAERWPYGTRRPR